MASFWNAPMPVTVQFGSFGGIGASSGFSPCPACRSAFAASCSSSVSGGGATSCSFSEVYSRNDRVRSYFPSVSLANQAPMAGRATSGLPVAW